MPVDQYLHNVRLVETKSNRVFYKKLGYIYMELPGFHKTEQELQTDEDKWLFCLKHMGNLNDIPLSLKEDPIFKKLFDIAEFSNLTPAEMNAYQQSLKIKRDNYNHDQHILNLGRQEERTKAEAEKKEMAQDMARELKKEAVSINIIVKTTKLSIEEIEAL